VSAGRRTRRDWRRRQLGQNFLDAAIAEQIVEAAGLIPGELVIVIEIGAGAGAFTHALARRAVRLIAVEPDPDWACRLRERLAGNRNVRVLARDFLAVDLPREPFRVVGSLPFSRTTDILRRLLDDPATPLRRADVVVQGRWRSSARPVRPRRCSRRRGRRGGKSSWPGVFRRGCSGDAAGRWRVALAIRRREPPMLPARIAEPFAAFLHQGWRFGN
jgi:23S rRNA (adenine-N6)-dimethyltransferase